MYLNLFISIGLLAFVVYALVFLFYTKWFTLQNKFVINENLQPQTNFSIIIPARNEALHIENAVQTVLQQNYPLDLFEIIVVEDYSEDETAIIVEALAKENKALKLIKMSAVLGNEKINSYKKKAIEIAIQQAKGNWIVCTDADCVVNPNWLQTLDNYIQQQNVEFVAAPVQFFKEVGWFNLFQQIDFATLQAITAATTNNGFHTLSNGANMAYSKKAYTAVDGFKGIDDVASGDDLLLLQKIKQQFKNKVGYLLHSHAVVKTHAMPTLKTFFNQRIRWASKTKRYTDKNMIWVLSTALLLNLSLVISFVAMWRCSWLAIYFLAIIFLKALAEWQLIKKAHLYFIQTTFFRFLILQPSHILYVCIAAWLSFFGKYTWKERRVK